MQVSDSVRVQNRILTLYRSRAIATSDSLYKQEQRADWIGMLPNRMQRTNEEEPRLPNGPVDPSGRCGVV